jgi:ABC-type sugar transport system permease subunit
MQGQASTGAASPTRWAAGLGGAGEGGAVVLKRPWRWESAAHAQPAARSHALRLGRHDDSVAAALFLAPSLLVLGAFVYYPLVSSAYTSLTDWEVGARVTRFVGLRNYARLAADPRFVSIVLNTAVYSLVVVAASMLLGLGLALLLRRQLVARGFYRTVLFAPYVTSTAVVAVLWTWIFDPQLGLANAILRTLLLPTSGWLSSREWAMPVVMLLAIWRNAGYSTVIFLAGLQNVPSVLHDAARIDGATSARVFWHVTLPLLTPTTLFLAVTGLITSFQVFDAVAVMTQGGPLESTNVLAFHLYQQAFVFFKLGYASSVAMVLFAVVMLLTAVQMVAARRWVHYD